MFPAPSDGEDRGGLAATPAWRAFKASVDELNAYIRPSVLRKFQSDILNRGKFTVVSPVCATPVEVTRSALVGNHIAYLIAGRPNCWLVAGFVGRGHHLHGLITEGDGTLYNLDERRQHDRRRLLQEDVDELLKRGHQNLSISGTSRATLVVGHENFAHHLWNELSALDEWLEGASEERVAGLSILATAEPIGPLAEIFPRLAGAKVVPASRELLGGLGRDAPIAVRVGARLVTDSIRRKVRDFCKTQALGSHPARPLLGRAWPRVWASVRLGSRTADNLDEFLLGVFRKTFAAYPEALFLLDGFSFPYGFFDDARTVHYRDKFAGWAGAADEFIASLCLRAREQIGAEAASRIFSVSGLTLPQAIELGGHCDYYVCHIGTLQHKVAWVHNIPGFLHRPNPSKRHAIWHAAQVEQGIIPDIVTKKLVIASDSPSRRDGGWNLNYAFADADRAAQCVLDSMQRNLVAAQP